ncbi:MAG: hypothetical protein M5R41_10380 [Bacteroidia bacterium]|nr:hypothetical protein [Bacteroidia bacterium]
MKFFDLGNTPETGQENQQQRSLISAELRQWCPLLDYMEFYQIVGSADKPLKDSTATGGEHRDLNAPFPDNIVDPDYADIALKIFGGKIQVDDAHVRRHAGDKALALATLRLREMKKWARRVGQNLQYAVVNNTTVGDTRRWDGMLASLPAGRTTSLSDTLATDDKVKKLVEKIAYAVSDIPGGAQFIIMDSGVRSRLSTLGMGYVQLGMNELGTQVRSIENVPIVIAGYSSSGARVLPWTSGAGANATKVIVGRSGEQQDIAFASNVGLVVKDLGLIDPHWTTKVEFDIDMEILSDESIYVIDEIQAS